MVSFSFRSLAETYYQLGVAYTFTTDFKEAVKSFESAAGVIKLRIENLKYIFNISYVEHS